MTESSLDIDFSSIDEDVSVLSSVLENTALFSTADRQQTTSDDLRTLEALPQSPTNKRQSPSSEVSRSPKGAKHHTFDFSKISKTPLIATFSLPIVNRQTVDSNTYDLGYLLDAQVQKRAQGAHRFTLSQPPYKSAKQSSERRSSSRAGFAEDSLDLFQSSQLGGVCNVKERFWDKAAYVQEKLEILRADKELEEMAACTFSPRTNPSVSHRPRSSQEFANSMQDFVKARETKLEVLRSERTGEGSGLRPFTPEICAKSRLIAERISPKASTVYDRLHAKKRTTLELKLDRLQKTNSHQVLSPSSYQKKDQTTGDSLPAEAVKKLNAIPEAKGRPSKHLASKSEAILLKKLLIDFEQSSFNYEGSRLNCMQTKELMQKLQFVSDTTHDLLVDMWRELHGDTQHSIAKSALLQFLGAVLGLDVPQRYIPDERKVSRAQREQWHGKFIDFYRHKSVKVPAEKRLVDKFVQPTFSPKIDINSRKLQEKASKARLGNRGQTIGDLLLGDRSRINEKLELLKAEQKQAEAAECTFKPVLVARPTSIMTAACGSEALYRYSKLQRQMRVDKQQTAETERRVKELKGCTFKPKTNSCLSSPKDSMIARPSFQFSSTELRTTQELQRGQRTPRTNPQSPKICAKTPHKSGQACSKATVTKAFRKTSQHSSSTAISKQGSTASLHSSRSISRTQSFTSTAAKGTVSGQPQDLEANFRLSIPLPRDILEVTDKEMSLVVEDLAN
jgi:hypothetical protein